MSLATLALAAVTLAVPVSPKNLVCQTVTVEHCNGHVTFHRMAAVVPAATLGAPGNFGCGVFTVAVPKLEACAEALIDVVQSSQGGLANATFVGHELTFDAAGTLPLHQGYYDSSCLLPTTYIKLKPGTVCK